MARAQSGAYAKSEEVMVENVCGRKILDARRARGWTQAHLGQKVGASPNLISQIERGEKFDLNTMTRIAAVLELDLDLMLRQEVGMYDEVEAALLTAPHLQAGDRELMLEVYRLCKERGPLGQVA
jgi:transcriptional regulator with XRE-family HTH domain